MSQLIQIVLHPARFRNCLLPGAFDAAEFLVNNHWEELSYAVKRAVSRILINSGQYE